VKRSAANLDIYWFKSRNIYISQRNIVREYEQHLIP